MATWTNATVTSKGYALQAKLLSTDKLDITRVVSGSGRATPGQLVNQTAVSNIQQTLTVESLTYDDNGNAKLRVLLNNEELTTSYVCNQIGIYATDPDEGEVLFAIVQEATTGLSIPSITEQPLGYNCGWVFALTYSNSSNIDVTIDPTNAVTIEAGDARYLRQTDAETTYFKKEDTSLRSGDYIDKLTVTTDSNSNTGIRPSSFVQIVSSDDMILLSTVTPELIGLQQLSSSLNPDKQMLLSSKTIMVGKNNTCLGDNSLSHSDSTNNASDIIENLSVDTSNDDIITAWETSKFSLAKGAASRTSGINCLALGDYSTAEGNCTVASGGNSRAEGRLTQATSYHSHAEGYDTEASNEASHAEGKYTIASGNASHAQNGQTTASGNYSDATGYKTVASGVGAHSGGRETTASGDYSSATGLGNTANRLQTVIGRYADTSTTAKGGVTSDSSNGIGSLFVIGNGTGDSALSNAFRVSASGGVYGCSSYSTSNADTAYFREWLDGNPNSEDRIGFFVVLEGEKVRKATADDDDIFGIVSDSDIASFIANNYADEWQGKYLRDVFGRQILEDVVIEAYTDEDGVEHPARVEKQPKLNPDYDPTQEYIPREERPEWDVISIFGENVIIDDGTCQVNGYVKPNKDGIGTAAEGKTPFRVEKRIDESHVLVFHK